MVSIIILFFFFFQMAVQLADSAVRREQRETKTHSGKQLQL